MVTKVKPIPEGYHSVNANLIVKDGVKAIEFYKKAFGAQEMYRKMWPDGRLMHAALKLGDSTVMLGDECPDHPGHEENCPRAPSSIKGSSVNLFIYVDNADAVFKQAVSSGAKGIMPVDNMFWGDRMGMVKDPYGHFWSIATHVEELSPEEMDKRAEAMLNVKA
jgi:PhnB protein